MDSLSPASYEPDRRLNAKVLRRLTQWRTALPLDATPDRAIVTFTFDDFPKSAARIGASIVERIGGKATFYACSGVMGRANATGDQYTNNDLAALQASGHEIGAHTHNHIDCWRTPPGEVLADIDQNLQKLEEMGVSTPIRQFAYPYGETQFALKQALIGKFRAARGILPGVNRKGSDLMQLRALELDREPTSTDRAIATIEAAARNPGWVILFTHDVADWPSPFGIKTRDLERIAQRVQDAGAAVLSMTEALDQLQRSTEQPTKQPAPSG